MRYLDKACYLATALFISMGSSIYADAQNIADPLSWVQERDQLWSVDSSDAGNAPNFFSYILIITSSGGDGPQLQFSCQATNRGDKSLQIGFKLDPQNTYEQAPKQRLRFLEMSGILTIGDDRKSERFQYHPDSSKITPYNRSVPKRLFNAVVRGDAVQLKVQNNTYNIALPGTDEAFSRFAKKCPVINGGKFDQSIFDQDQLADTGVSGAN